MRTSLAAALLLAAHASAAAEPLVLERRAVAKPGDRAFVRIVEDRFAIAAGEELCARAAETDCGDVAEKACGGPRALSDEALSAYREAAPDVALRGCPGRLRQALERDGERQEQVSAACRKRGEVRERLAKACRGALARPLDAWFRDADAACDATRALDGDAAGDLLTALWTLGRTEGCPGAAPRKTRAWTAASREPAGASVGTGLPAAATLESLVLNGALTFVARRAKEEAVAFVVDQVSADLCRRAAALLPSTCALVKAAGETRSLVVPGRLLKQAIADDLHALPESLGKLMEDGDAPDGVDPRAWKMMACGLRVGDGYYAGLLRQSPPLTLALDAVDRLGSLAACRTALGFAAARGPAPGWLPEGELVRTAVETLVRLVVHAPQGDVDGWELDVEALVASITAEAFPELGARLDEVKAVARRLGPPVLRVRRAAASLRGAADDAARAAALRELIGAAVDLVAATSDEILARVPDTSAVRGARRAIVATNLAAARLLQGDYTAGFAAIVSSGVVPAGWQPYGELLRFSTLVVDVGAATTSDEVAEAIERAAAPAGSWRARRKRRTVSVASQVGVLYAGESLRGETAVPDAPQLGLFVPIGVDVSFPVATHWAAGAMLYPIDLGNLARVRLDSGSVTGGDGTTEQPETEPNVGVAQVLSFGASAYLGLWKTPFVLFLTGSYAPAHRVVTQTTSTGTVEKTFDAWQLGVGVAVDVPLFIW